MAHLHEAWWQEVHLLTISHLGSGGSGKGKASNLILTILQLYTPPSKILSPMINSWERIGWLGKFLSQVQLERRIAWILAREFELATQGYAECLPDGTTTEVGAALSSRAALLVQCIIDDEDRYEAQRALLTTACRLVQRQGNEEVITALLCTLRGEDSEVRERVAGILGEVGLGKEAVVNELLQMLHDKSQDVSWAAANSLGQMGAGNEAVVNALLQKLHDGDPGVQAAAAAGLGKVGTGNEVVVKALLEVLHDEEALVQAAAARSLGRVRMGNEAVVSALLGIVDHLPFSDPDWSVWEAALRSLGQVGTGNKGVVNALLQLDVRVRCKRYHDRGPHATNKVSHFPQESAMLERKFERAEGKKGVSRGTSR